MKKTLKIILIFLLSVIVLIFGGIIFFLGITKNAKIDQEKLINLEKTVSFYDKNDNFLFKESNEKNVTLIENIPTHVQNAFISIEDKRFYKHNGIDYKGLLRALFNNIKSFSFKEGGSTITQQLIKNTHLSSEKTLKRKLSEIRLAIKLENQLNKKEILEKYLNTIYFGDNCYGITDASKHYFDKTPEQLTINESATLAGIIKAPSIYSPFKNLEKSNNRKNLVLSKMHEQGYINNKTLIENQKSPINVIKNDNSENIYDYKYLATKEFNEIIKNYPYFQGELNVYLSVDIDKQNLLENTNKSNEYSCDKSCLLLNKESQIEGYFSTCGNVYRQAGSTLKPLISYAPAIENNVVYSCTPLLDEKTNFNGYSPSNYNDNYYGFVSVKDSLAKSLNVCSAKLLNYVGIEKAKSFVKKTDIPLTKNDNSLCLALGATEKGVKLTELCSGYEIFLNDGYYSSPYIIKAIKDQNNNLVYKHFNKKIKVFSEETTSIINDMTENVVKNGTGKKLSFTNIPLCAKTGTVGTDNGNTDAYTISYNSDYILGVWFGNADNFLMPNSYTGGNQPCSISSIIWQELYKNSKPPLSFNPSSKVCEKYIDKIEYETNNNVILANDLTPERYKIKALFKNSHLPKTVSNQFIEPFVKNASVFYENNQIKISLCVTELYDFLIYKYYQNTRNVIYDSYRKNKCEFVIDKNVRKGEIYQYSIVPYYKTNDKIIYGKETKLQKIKIPSTNLNEWWKNDLS